jgi:murein DD-endopeptidase MepM/ murein hydrolase activator NlpD
MNAAPALRQLSIWAFGVALIGLGLSGCLNVFVDDPGKVVLFENRDAVRQQTRATPSNKTLGNITLGAAESRVHIVRSGDTVYQISRRYDTSIRSIIDANNLRAPYVLKNGERLTLPPPRFHTVRDGETIYGISRRYNLAMNQLVRSNGIKPPYHIGVGQRLKLSDARAQTPLVAKPPLARIIRTPITSTGKGDKPKQEKPAPKRMAKHDSQSVKPSPRAGKLFLLPVRGKVISRFGPKRKGLHNDGINITAPNGAAVRAAENGVVVYSGNELLGYGNMVLLRHADGYMTAYGHNGTILVQKGQRVRRGQVISRVGSSGNVSVPQLHFEIRKGKTAVNPAKFIKGLS